MVLFGTKAIEFEVKNSHSLLGVVAPKIETCKLPFIVLSVKVLNTLDL